MASLTDEILEVDEQGVELKIDSVETDYKGFIARTLAIQETISGLLTTRSFTKEVGTKVRVEVTELIRVIIEQQSLISHILGRNSSESKKVEEVEQIEKKKYSEVVKSKEEKRKVLREKSKNLSVVAIYPRREDSESTQTKSEIQASLDPSVIQVGIRSVKRIRKGGIVVETESEIELKRLIDELNKNDKFVGDYRVERPKRRKPEIIVYSVDEEIKETEIVKLLIRQNSDILEEGKVEYKSKFKARSGFNYILKVESDCFYRVLKARKLNIGWVRCEVKEHLRPTLCFKCGLFGHISRNCRNLEKCLNCGKIGHKRGECTSKSACGNCVAFNTKFGSKLEIEHSCLDRKCRIWEKEIERLISRTDYGRIETDSGSTP